MEEETKANSKVLVQQDFKTLVRWKTVFRLCYHGGPADILVSILFKPEDLNSSKLHLGLMVLMFVVQQHQELLLVLDQRGLNQESSFNTTKDILKTKPGVPKFPQTLDKTINAIHRSQEFTSYYLGGKSSYTVKCREVFIALNKSTQLSMR